MGGGGEPGEQLASQAGEVIHVRAVPTRGKSGCSSPAQQLGTPGRRKHYSPIKQSFAVATVPSGPVLHWRGSFSSASSWLRTQIPHFYGVGRRLTSWCRLPLELLL